MTAASPLQALPTARYALTQMLGAGEDGAAYLARDGGGDYYIVHRLKKLGFERRRELEQRLKLRRLLKGVRVVGIVSAELDGDEPSVIFERVEGSLGQLLHTGSLEREMALKIIHSTAQAIAESHRVGLMHGNLCPEAVRLREDRCSRTAAATSSTRAAARPTPTRGCRPISTRSECCSASRSTVTRRRPPTRPSPAYTGCRKTKRACSSKS
jgi:hypothetical protein